MALTPLAGRSIAVRLAVSALFWSTLILLVAGLLLAGAFREITERAFDQRLLVYANDLASDLVTPGALDQREAGGAGDPRFQLPLSGWYWQVGRPGARIRDMRTSRSLLGNVLRSLAPEDESRRFGEIRKGYVDGPDERRLRVVERDIDLGEDGRFIVRVAGPAQEIRTEVRGFTLALAGIFGVLGLALALSTLLQIRFGLQPLTRLRGAVNAVRRGEADRIAGEYPKDVAPLAGELNLLLETNRDILERARTQVGNLAHALKTPLSVLVNEADTQSGPLADKVREQAELMRGHVGYHLDRARAAALAGTLGTLTEVEPVVAALARTFPKIYRDKDLSIDVAIPPGLRFRGERQDFEEMVGNLLDNAAKWAAARVGVTVEPGDVGRGTWRIVIEDDGPGMPAEMRASSPKRGQRLDETKPGSGLGLSIVADVAALYRGRLLLEESAMGGLRAVLELPGDGG
ncbi:MAG TPA: sensor histidine kinase [Salinarimonas sp.]|nr:sensor histidine kinase [Salinarimonas sp.]